MEDILWFVVTDMDDNTYATKIEAEKRAREMYPNESPDFRYARVMCRRVNPDADSE
jgi:hypothetical protein